MSAVSTSTFVFRDFLKYILPTIFAACLFGPLVIPEGITISTELLVFVAAILGYVVYSPVVLVASKVHEYIPIKRLNIKNYYGHEGKWGLGRLWFIMDKDEREYLYLTQSYFEMYQVFGFYTILYAFAGIVDLVDSLPVGCASLTGYILNERMPMLGGIQIPTILTIPVSLLLSGFLFYNASIEYGVLHGDDGFYDELARKYQKQAGGVALSIWGYVKNDDGIGIRGVNVLLRDEQGNDIDKNCTDDNGFFLMKDTFAKCQGMLCRLVVEGQRSDGIIVKLGEKVVKLGEKSDPCYTLTVEQWSPV